MNITNYNREEAVNYAYKYAMSRNPKYLDFDSMGGDCTNFCSQCLYAGTLKMNYKKVYGWYYINGNNKTPSWTGVEYFYNFLIGNKGIGPFAREVNIGEVEEGDFIQLSFDGKTYQHNMIVTSADEFDIKIACHTYDRLNISLTDFYYIKQRCLKIEGVRNY